MPLHKRRLMKWLNIFGTVGATFNTVTRGLKYENILKKAGVTILISEKINFKPKNEIRVRRALHNDKGDIP